MKRNLRLSVLAATTLLVLDTGFSAQAQSPNMTFFITSTPIGNGGDLGGLAGADQHCQRLAAAAGAGNKVWRAYLSTVQVGSAVCTNARNRIGNGPWQNSAGVVIARSVDELHGSNNVNKNTALSEQGRVINGVGDTPNMHDILTGSTTEGLCFPPGEDSTCGNWTSDAAGAAVVGHHDRQGVPDTEANKSWNSTHKSRSCSQADLRATGGNGLLYCFAIN